MVSLKTFRESFSFLICLHTKDLLHHPRNVFAIFGRIYQNVSYFLAVIWIEKNEKNQRKIWEAAALFLTNVKHCTRKYILAFSKRGPSLYSLYFEIILGPFFDVSKLSNSTLRKQIEGIFLSKKLKESSKVWKTRCRLELIGEVVAVTVSSLVAA